MSSEDPHQGDARGRKQQRDRQNQRLKRRRDKATMQNLEQRNASLERQVKILYQGANEKFRQQWDTVQLMRAGHTATDDRLKQLDAFVKSWAVEEAQTWTPEMESLNCLPDREDTTNEIQPDSGIASRTVGETEIDDSPPASCNMDILRSNGAFPQPVHAADEMITPPILCFCADTACSCAAYGVSSRSIPSGRGSKHTAPIMTGPWMNPTPAQPTKPQELVIEITKVQETFDQQEWQRLPSNIAAHICYDPYGPIMRQLRSSPSSLDLCSAQPAALDLLLGGSLNELANAVYEASLHGPLRRTEKFAINWISYLITRWLIVPSQESYANIPVMSRPTAKQLFVPHAPIFDYVVWPQMRDNFINHGMKYCRGEVFGLLFCTCRVRDTHNAEFVVRTGGSEPRIDPVFLEKISNVDGWVLLEKFWVEYPELVVGLDPQKVMILEQDLI